MSRRRKILIVIGLALAAAIVIPVVHHFQLRHSLNVYIAELKAKGEPLDLAQVVPPPVPPEKNGAPLITNALYQIYSFEISKTNSLVILNPPGDILISSSKVEPGWKLPIIHNIDGRWPTNTWDDLATQLVEIKSYLNDFQKLPYGMALDFNDARSNEVSLTQLVQPKVAFQWLRASVQYNLHQGNTAAACADVQAMLALVKGSSDDRWEISQLVNDALAQMASSSTWEILQTTNITVGELAELQQKWQSLEFVAPMEKAFLFERALSLKHQNQLRQSPAGLLVYARVPETRFVPKSRINGKLVDYDGTTNFVMVSEKSFAESERSIFVRVAHGISKVWHCFVSWPYFYSYTDEVNGLKEWQIIFSATHMAETNASLSDIQSFVNTNFSQLGFERIKQNPYAIFSVNANQLPALRKAVLAEQTKNAVITAIALKRYELQRHEFPATLNELVPNFLKAVPNDGMDGQPLRYRRNADGRFLLYSIGDNGKDDGGDPISDQIDTPGMHYSPRGSWENPHSLDWVWPQLATPAEIQKYNDEQAKKAAAAAQEN